MTIFLVALVILGTAVGDLLKAAAMRRLGGFRLRTLARTGRIAAGSGLLWLSIAGYTVSFFAFMALLSVEDVSFAVPATAAGYVLETLLAQWLLKETVSARRWAGAGLVVVGVALIGG